jgi:subtilase family serine protease
MSVLENSRHPWALSQSDAGRLPADNRLQGITIVFSRTAAQQADLAALLDAQQDPESPLFHQWLTPDQFAQRFGLAESDINKVQSWLEQQGFSVDSVARSRNSIRFSGSVRQVEQAFQTQLHYFNVNGEKHFAASTDLSLPAALAPVVLAVRNLDDFRPRPMHVQRDFTSAASGNVFFAPGDIRVAYDMNPLVNSAINGSGQSVAIMGQSAIVLSDIESFQKAAGLTVMDPTLVLVPGTGNSQTFTGDQGESSLDLEWAGAMATGANIIFVYTGGATDTSGNLAYGVFDSINYAVDQRIGDIISVSYGACETGLSTSVASALEAVMAQGAVQGQTILAASGDAGSTGCYGQTSLSTAQQQALAVSYPASSQYVTGVGGTEIDTSNSNFYTQGKGYWAAQTSTDQITSALQYIPEMTWNDSLLSGSSSGGLSATGGGVSALFSKPTWQAGVPGIPADGKRDVPDVSLYSSPDYVGYLFCTSDQSNWSTGQNGSCVNGFRDGTSPTTGLLTIAGGTSFATPIFAGMVAIINQKLGYVAGSGLINKPLYQLASNSVTYSQAFHDITKGNNFCPSSLTSVCTGPATSSFAAGTGYDLTTGLGSVDLNALVNVTGWPAASTLIGTTTSVVASSSSPNINTNVTFTITVTVASGSAATGSVKISVDGGGTSYGSGTTTTVALTGNGTATYTTQFTTAGNHQVVAQFPGDTTHAASTGVASVSVQGTSNPGTFSMSATSVTIKQGGTSSTSITVTPANGYKGTVNITPSSTNASFCYNSVTAVVSGTAAVMTTMTIDTNLNDCGGAVSRSHGLRLYRPGSPKVQVAPRSRSSIAKSAFGIAGIFFAGLIGWRLRRSRLVVSLIALGILGFALSACGGGGSSSNNNDTPKGTYTITLTGQDTATSTITANTTFSLTVN